MNSGGGVATGMKDTVEDEDTMSKFGSCFVRTSISTAMRNDEK